MSKIEVTKEFIDALKMMNNIDQTLVINADSEYLASKSTHGNRVGYTKTDIRVPRKFCIYDLREFIRILAVVDSPVLDFSNDRYVIIMSKDGNTKIQYSDADEIMVESGVERAVNLPSEDYTIEVPFDSLKNALNAASVMRLDKIGFLANGETVSVVARKEANGNASDAANGDGSNQVSSSFQKKIGETEDEYDAIFDQDDLKLVDSDCTISICKHCIAKVSFGNHTIYVGLDNDSKLD